MTVDDDGVHLDEGTIHAWLDGELDEEQTGRIQAHIGRCGACAAHVAEARGLIAGASRVIGMLDETPSRMVRPAVAPTASTDLSVWRLLRVTPARASIAAMLVVAVGIALTRGQLSRSVTGSSRLQDATLPMSAATAASAPQAPSLENDTILNSAIQRRLAAEQPPRTVERAPGVALPSPPLSASPAPNADLADAEQKVVAGRAAVAEGRVMSAAGADRTRAGVGQQVVGEAVTTSVAANAARAADAVSLGGATVPPSTRALASGAIAAGQCLRVESASPTMWGSVKLPMIVAVDSTGQEARVLSPSGEDTEARAYLQYNGADSALFRLRRIGFDGTMSLLASSGTRTGTLQSSSNAQPSTARSAMRDRRPVQKSAPASSEAVANAAITAHRVQCPPTP